VPNVDPSNHVPWLESKRRSRARRAEARKARSRGRRRKTGAIVVAASLTFAVGGAVAHDNVGSTSVHEAGSTVSRLQSVLGVTPDGVYGANTRRAVRNYQRNHGLAVDGIAGPVTLASLGLASAGASSSGASASTSAPSSTLQKIAMCESSGNPAAVNSTGQYRGKYQFDMETWREYGGTGDPAAAPEAVQDQIAAKLLAARGTSPWPVCGK
jgi:peptidoglycan hydrolase-like protein with peptidoglycan-binding domain